MWGVRVAGEEETEETQYRKRVRTMHQKRREIKALNQSDFHTAARNQSLILRSLDNRKNRQRPPVAKHVRQRSSVGAARATHSGGRLRLRDAFGAKGRRAQR